VYCFASEAGDSESLQTIVADDFMELVIYVFDCTLVFVAASLKEFMLNLLEVETRVNE
jgi:hypothetical protein